MLKYNLKDFMKGYQNGIINKAYYGLSNDYLWKPYDASIESIYGLRMASTDYIQYTRAHDDAPLLMSIGGKSYQFARGWDALEGYYTRLYQIGGSEVGRWHEGEMVEVSYDVPIEIYNLNHFVEDYDAEIAEMEKVGRVVYQRVLTPIYRKQSGETYCVGFDKMVEEYSQVSFDDGQTWITTATTEVLVEHNSEDCGYQKPSIKSVSATHFTTQVDADGNLNRIHSTADSQSQLTSRCYIQVKGITSITFKTYVSVDNSGLRFYSSKDNYQSGTTIRGINKTWTLGDLDPSLTYGIQVQLIGREGQYITGTNCGADITYTTLE